MLLSASNACIGVSEYLVISISCKMINCHVKELYSAIEFLVLNACSLSLRMCIQRHVHGNFPIAHRHAL